MKTTLILVRHGETAKNIEGKLHQKSDIESLTDIGREQITKAAERIKKYKIAKIYSSAETRAIESAAIIAEICDVEAGILNGMGERNWGVFANEPWSEVKVVLDKLTFEERFKFIPQGGESWEFFEKRLMGTVARLLAMHSGETIAIVTHGGAIRALIPYLLGVPKEESYKYDPKNASITVVEFEGRKIRPVVVDNTDHLY